ncbi:YdbC family protein [Gracilinema caldarium]|uniref:Uncharacterized conserved protein UCP037246 n=1 Tax=Gracilinema caldarium (strain ATCC 51460 / DSM 7334 / H1) TaxID=744872 RepID=F8EYM0_GRAC1|nr:PC4/YdbC family ssDNA-binding protein [Gracilinema caldarium]AEJ18597.1 Uncharacterized conserved protein UCP037246 [Gracilinema caldarium DSM 7334]
MSDITFEITKHFGVLSEEKSGWKKELNMVSWNNRAPKLDIRDWSPDHEKMGKGITLTKEEAQKLLEFLTGAINSVT